MPLLLLCQPNILSFNPSLNFWGRSALCYRVKLPFLKPKLCVCSFITQVYVKLPLKCSPVFTEWEPAGGSSYSKWSRRTNNWWIKKSTQMCNALTDRAVWRQNLLDITASWADRVCLGGAGLCVARLVSPVGLLELEAVSAAVPHPSSSCSLFEREAQCRDRLVGHRGSEYLKVLQCTVDPIMQFVSGNCSFSLSRTSDRCRQTGSAYF